MSKIGLIAGKGLLPEIWAKSARENDKEVYVYQLSEATDNSLERIADQVSVINIGQLDKLIKTLLADNIKKVVMIGKVEKSLLYQDLPLDDKLKKLLAGLEILNDDSILMGIVNELAREGIEVIPQSTFLEALFPEKGVLTAHEPDEQLISDMRYGFKLAREIGRLDIGQTVVVKNRAVLAVEAIEGTDQTIKRGGEIGGKGIVVAKVSKPHQDFRFDIPTVGETTLKNLIATKASGLVVEAGRTFLIDQDNLVKMAEDNGITIMALEEE